ncbi:MAG: hypothetical protein DCF22_18305 [Leptolyngbya sp.]|nr:MAG: hypothetical protein DCF22_18305 [Leptolyngbya sp.]
MNTRLVKLSCEIELQTGEKLVLPDAIVNNIGVGRWLISIAPINDAAQTSPSRYHDAFLNSYSAEDEGLYDDYSTR